MKGRVFNKLIKMFCKNNKNVIKVKFVNEIFILFVDFIIEIGCIIYYYDMFFFLFNYDLFIFMFFSFFYFFVLIS